jgi:hypothetical protein
VSERRLPTLLEALVFSFGVLGFVFLFWCISGCARMARPATLPATGPIPVCVEMQLQDADDARRGIEWWGEEVEWVCPARITIREAAPGETTIRDTAFAWNDGIAIVWARGDVYRTVRHEFGHVLGYGEQHDVPGVSGLSGAMSSGAGEGAMCYGHGGVW